MIMLGARLWRSAALVSGIALMVVISQIEVAGLSPLFRNLDWQLLGLACGLLVIEALASSIRIWWLSGRQRSPAVAIALNAWYMLYLMLLPARLGEVAAIGLLRDKLGQTTGGATASIVIQRMFDVLILAACVVLATAIAAAVETWLLVTLGSVLLTLVLVRLKSLLTLAATCLLRWSGAGGIRQKLLRLVLQARTWSLRRLDFAALGVLLVLTALKWSASLLALVLVLLATGIDLEAYVLLPVVIAYVFLSIIPLQSLAGVGVSDVGLLALLVGLGVDSGTGAAATLFCRLSLITFTACYAGVVLLPGVVARG